MFRYPGKSGNKLWDQDFGHFIIILCKSVVCCFIELVSILANEDILENL